MTTCPILSKPRFMKPGNFIASVHSWLATSSEKPCPGPLRLLYISPGAIRETGTGACSSSATKIVPSLRQRSTADPAEAHEALKTTEKLTGAAWDSFEKGREALEALL